MGYRVVVVGPSGRVTCIRNGREVVWENARYYPHPSAAQKAADSYRQKHPGQIFFVEVRPFNEEL